MLMIVQQKERKGKENDARGKREKDRAVVRKSTAVQDQEQEGVSSSARG